MPYSYHFYVVIFFLTVCPVSLAESAVEILLCQLVLWMMEHFLGASFFNHLTQIHEDDVVGDAESLAKGVGYHHDAVILLQFGEELLHFLAADRVEGGSTLICKQITWLYGKAACQAKALLLTAAQLGSRTLQSILHFLPETYCLEIMLYDAVQFFLLRIPWMRQP